MQRSHRKPGFLQTLRCRASLFQKSFLRFTIIEEHKSDSDIKKIDFHALFHKKLLAFISPLENNTYGIYDPLGVRLLNRLRLNFSHLREHKFTHNFAGALNRLCQCSLESKI